MSKCFSADESYLVLCCAHIMDAFYDELTFVSWGVYFAELELVTAKLTQYYQN